ncbi:MAG TPA: hypothetical protein PLX15_04830 [Candidatus Woesearchaeota archaeon]|nr:hypothetical protein [Candidatus Woesearchaeota archaeon]
MKQPKWFKKNKKYILAFLITFALISLAILTQNTNEEVVLEETIFSTQTLNTPKQADLEDYTPPTIAPNKIHFRTINAMCDKSDPNCYYFSLPFNYQLNPNDDKIRILQIRIEESDLKSPEIVYYEHVENLTPSQKPEKKVLDSVRFSKIEYPIIGDKGNLFFELLLEQNKVYCFQIIDGEKKSDIWCQNLSIEFLSEDLINFMVVKLDDNTTGQIHLVVDFSDFNIKAIKETLGNATLDLEFPRGYNLEAINFSGKDLLNNYFLCDDVHNLVLLNISLELETIDSLLYEAKDDDENLESYSNPFVVTLKHKFTITKNTSLSTRCDAQKICFNMTKIE